MCSKYFTCKNRFVANHWVNHPDKKVHICGTFCRGYLMRAVLWMHQEPHPGNKPYRCDLCGKACTLMGAHSWGQGMPFQYWHLQRNCISVKYVARCTSKEIYVMYQFAHWCQLTAYAICVWECFVQWGVWDRIIYWWEIEHLSNVCGEDLVQVWALKQCMHAHTHTHRWPSVSVYLLSMEANIWKKLSLILFVIILVWHERLK